MKENFDNQVSIHETQPTKTSTSKWQVDVKKILAVLFVAVLSGGLFGGIGYFYGKFSSPEDTKMQNYQPSQKVLPSPTNTPVGTNIYISQNLGVSFSYQSISYYQSGNVPVILQPYEIGDKIYFSVGVTPGIEHPKDDQYIEVFQKNPSDDLITAIKKTILTNYPSPECQTGYMDRKFYNVDIGGFSDNFVVARISLSHNQDSQGNVIFSSPNCPEPYTATNFLSYFVMDTNHPDKFLFFNVGQQPIGGGDDSIIQKSLKILS